jgi:hypothetical protein
MAAHSTEERKQFMLKALEQTLGVVTTAALKANVARDTHYDWMKKDKDYRAKVREIENVALDFAESQLHKQIQKGNPLSTIFYLKCKGKKRGYIEQQDVQMKGNMKFKAEFGESNPIQSAPETTGDSQSD